MKRRGKAVEKLRPVDLTELRALHEAESLPVLRREQRWPSPNVACLTP